ncbi:MAG: hypothetical protein ACLQT6_16005 [Desulfomonilaceae bacterium]
MDTVFCPEALQAAIDRYGTSAIICGAEGMINYPIRWVDDVIFNF